MIKAGVQQRPTGAKQRSHARVGGPTALEAAPAPEKCRGDDPTYTAPVGAENSRTPSHRFANEMGHPAGAHVAPD